MKKEELTYRERFEISKRKREASLRRKFMIGMGILLLVLSFFIHLKTKEAKEEYKLWSKELSRKEEQVKQLKREYRELHHELAEAVSPYMMQVSED